MLSAAWIEDAANILRHVVSRHRAGQACGLVVVTATTGGALRAPGALAAVDAGGRMSGYVSNGCVDGDVVAQMLAAFAAGTPSILRYGAGSPWQDIRLPCGGSLELTLIPRPRTEPLAALVSALDGRSAAVMDLDRISPDIPGEATARKFALTPRPALRLAGRGAPFAAMARLGSAAGFELSLASPDPEEFGALARLPLRAAHHLAVPGDLPRVTDDPLTAVVLLFHDHEWEPALLVQALDGSAGFIGAMAAGAAIGPGSRPSAQRVSRKPRWAGSPRRSGSCRRSARPI